MIARARWAWRHARARLLRTAALGLFFTALVAAFGAVRSAHARNEMLGAGAEMLRIPASPGGGTGERLLLNGAELQVRRGSTPRSVRDLLAEAEASCAPGAALRGGDEGRGFVACRDGEAMTLPVAYLYAERRGASTQFVGFSGSQPVDLRAIFPGAKDAPGRDPVGFPRPPGARRALSLAVVGEPYAATVYLDGERGLDDLVAHYQAALPRCGWKVVARWRVDEGPGPRQASVVVERAGALALLLVAHDRAGTSTTFLTMEAKREQQAK